MTTFIYRVVGYQFSKLRRIKYYYKISNIIEQLKIHLRFIHFRLKYTIIYTSVIMLKSLIKCANQQPLFFFVLVSSFTKESYMMFFS